MGCVQNVRRAGRTGGGGGGGGGGGSTAKSPLKGGNSSQALSVTTGAGGALGEVGAAGLDLLNAAHGMLHTRLFYLFIMFLFFCKHLV
jgi:hypothetical protein